MRPSESRLGAGAWPRGRAFAWLCEALSSILSSWEKQWAGKCKNADKSPTSWLRDSKRGAGEGRGGGPEENLCLWCLGPSAGTTTLSSSSQQQIWRHVWLVTHLETPSRHRRQRNPQRPQETRVRVKVDLYRTSEPRWKIHQRRAEKQPWQCTVRLAAAPRQWVRNCVHLQTNPGHAECRTRVAPEGAEKWGWSTEQSGLPSVQSDLFIKKNFLNNYVKIKIIKYSC
jgi:hypothetical protein